MANRGLPCRPVESDPQAAYFMKAVLARTNFENADLSDALMDRAVIVEANLKNAILQVGTPPLQPFDLHAPWRLHLGMCTPGHRTVATALQVVAWHQSSAGRLRRVQLPTCWGAPSPSSAARRTDPQ